MYFTDINRNTTPTWLWFDFFAKLFFLVVMEVHTPVIDLCSFEEVFSPTLNTFRIQLDRVPNHPVYTLLLLRKVECGDPWGPFQPAILWFYEVGRRWFVASVQYIWYYDRTVNVSLRLNNGQYCFWYPTR